MPSCSSCTERTSTKDALGYIQAVSDPAPTSGAQADPLSSYYRAWPGDPRHCPATGYVISSERVVGPTWTGRLQNGKLLRMVLKTKHIGARTPCRLLPAAARSVHRDQRSGCRSQQTGGLVRPDKSTRLAHCKSRNRSVHVQKARDTIDLFLKCPKVPKTTFWDSHAAQRGMPTGNTSARAAACPSHKRHRHESREQRVRFVDTAFTKPRCQCIFAR